MDDFTTVVQALIEGMRELPTDDAARVKHFLTEYLGSSRHPVPFGGRTKDFAILDDWLADRQAPPYALLAAPAGRGKSALLLRWCQRLLARPELVVVYFPVSIRFRTNLAGIVFPALVALLARLHGEKIPRDLHTREDIWHGLLTEFVTRPLPAGRQLVLVLDGVDEAADWDAGPWLFPEDPPPGLRVVLSARYLANDQDASAWLKRLGWHHAGLARTLDLYPLDRAGIASVLVQMGFPLDLLGARVDIVSELHRLSEGDPLLVRLYTDILWERGDAAMHLAPGDLRAIRPGLVGYFERWWNDQRLLWNLEASQREAAIQSVLNLLAGALGPLSKADILNLTPDDSMLKQGDIGQHLEPLARFVIGDGVRQGYVFSHPRLASYFLEERLSEAERGEVEQRFLAWGERTLAALNEGSLEPERASPYIVQYYGAHLERAHSGASALLALVSDGWRHAWEKLDRANAGFVGDSERAWRAAEHEDAAAATAGQLAPYLGTEIRSLLCRVSINSMTSNIAPRLMLEAVKTGVWTPAQGLASIRLISDLVPRARELVGLAFYVQEPQRTDILQEALDTIATIKGERVRLDALVELAPGFSEGLLGQILEAVPTIDDEADRAGVLAELAPALAPYPVLIEKALDFAREINDEEYFALALEGLAPCFTPGQHEHVLQLALAIDERYRVLALTALIPRLASPLLLDILRTTRLMRPGIAQVRLLAVLVHHLPEHLQAEPLQEALDLMRDIIDQEYRVELLVRLAPFLPAEKLQQTLQEIQVLWDESYRARALSSLHPHLLEEQLPAFQQVALAMKNEEQRTAVLLQVLPRLPEALQPAILDSVHAMWDEGLRVEILARLAPTIAESLLPRLVGLVRAIKDPGYSVWLVTELEATPGGKLHGMDGLQIFQAITDPRERLQTLLAIVPHMTDEMLAGIFASMEGEIFGFLWSIQRADRQAEIFTKLASRMPEAWIDRVMRQVSSLGSEAYQVQVLVALAPRLREIRLPVALDLVRAIKNRANRAQVLEALVAALPTERKGESVREMLQALQLIKDEAGRVHLFAEFAKTLSSAFPPEKLPRVLEAVSAMRSDMWRAQVLIALAPHLSRETFDEVLRALRMVRRAEERARVLEALTPHVSDHAIPAFLAVVRAIQEEHWRAYVLETMVVHISPATSEGVLALILDLRDEREQIKLLSTLAQRAPESTLPRLWEAVKGINDSGGHTWSVLGILSTRMPDEFFPWIWQAIQETQDEGWQIWLLGLLAPRMSERLFPQVWASVQGIADQNWRRFAIKELAAHVPERYFAEVFSVTLTLCTGQIRSAEEERARELDVEEPANALETLAKHVPESFFLQFWQAVGQIKDKWSRVRLWEILAGQVPTHCFAQVWESINEINDVWRRGKLWERLAPRIPDEFFARVWERVRTIQDTRLQASLLVPLALRVPESYIQQFWSVVKTIEDEVKQAQILKGLVPRLPYEMFTEVAEVALALPHWDGHMEVLEALILSLPAEHGEDFLEILLPPAWKTGEGLDKIFATLQGEQPDGWWERIMVALIPRLSEEHCRVIFPAFLKVALMRQRTDKELTTLLNKLTARVPREALTAMLGAIWSIKLDLAREPLLTSLISNLSPRECTDVLEMSLAKTRTTGEKQYLLQVLKSAASSQQLAPALLYPALRDVLHMLAQSSRHEALTTLAQLAPAILLSGGEEAVTAVCCAVLEIGHWWP